MSKAPSMPMYWDAYLADTTHLTTEEHGAYLLLLAAMWRRDGSVPDNDKDNARILGLSVAKWRKTKSRLASFLIFENDSISQKNLRKIWKKTQEKIQKNKQNGRLGGRPVSSKNKDLAKPNGFDFDNPNESIPEPEPYIDALASIKMCKSGLKRFDEFWDSFADKRGRRPAEKVWIRDKLDTKADEVIAGAVKYAAFRQTSTAQPKMAQGWLNDERWKDDLSTVKVATNEQKNYGASGTQSRANDLDRYKQKVAMDAARIPDDF